MPVARSWTSISGLMGYISFFENFVQIVVLLFAWIVVLLAFFILAIQLFVTLIEFKLTTLGGIRADPVRPVRQDGVCRRTRARQRHLVGRQGAGARRHRRHRLDIILAVHFWIRRQPADHRRRHVAWCWRRCRCWALASSVPASPTALSPEVRSSALAPPLGPALLLAASSPLEWLAPVWRREPRVAQSPLRRAAARRSPRRPPSRGRDCSVRERRIARTGGHQLAHHPPAGRRPGQRA